MWKLIEMSGFRTSSTTHAIIQKFINDNSQISFLITFTNDFKGDDIFYFFDNITDISKFHNILLSHGSTFSKISNNKFSLIGKKLLSIFDDDNEFYNLEYFNYNPFEIKSYDLSQFNQNNLSLLDIIKNRWNDDFSNSFWNKLFI